MTGVESYNPTSDINNLHRTPLMLILYAIAAGLVTSALVSGIRG